MDDVRVQVGNYLVIGKEKSWRVMEKFGAFRMQKKVFTNQDAAMARAARLDAERKAASLDNPRNHGVS